jgi:hypothetical protein
MLVSVIVPDFASGHIAAQLRKIPIGSMKSCRAIEVGGGAMQNAAL